MADEEGRAAYFWLLKQCLTGLIYRDGGLSYSNTDSSTSENGFDLERRRAGRDWPLQAHTMIGLQRLNNLQWCTERVIEDHVPGDLIEAGVWRGGATILMRAVLNLYAETDRRVWVADSFAGLPSPDTERYPMDAGLDLSTQTHLAVSLEEVQENFRAYGMLDDQVRFLKGWFKDTLAAAPIERLALMRLDGDLYESTIQALEALYPKLSPGGFIIIDDYGAIGQCKLAVDEFRRRFDLSESLNYIDHTGVFWRKPGHGASSTGARPSSS